MQLGHSHPVAFGCSLCANAAQFSLSTLFPLLYPCHPLFSISTFFFFVELCSAPGCLFVSLLLLPLLSLVWVLSVLHLIFIRFYFFFPSAREVRRRNAQNTAYMYFVWNGIEKRQASGRKEEN